MPKSVDILFITLSSPIYIGIYENNKLIDSVVSQKKSSDILPKLFDEFSQKYEIDRKSVV